MRKGYDRAERNSPGATQNLVLRVGFCFALIFNSVDASPASTAGGMLASSYAVGGPSVAVDNSIGLSSGRDGKAGGGSPGSFPANGGAVTLAIPVDLHASSQMFTDVAEPPPFRLHGIASLGHFRFSGTYDRADTPHVNHIVGTILAHLRDDAPLTAKRILEASDTASYLDPDDLAALKIRVAAGLLSHGQNREALALAEDSVGADENGGTTEALWIAALSGFGAEQYGKSLRYFTAVSTRSPDPWSLSAAAFWAGRSAERLGDRDGARRWLRTAAAQKGTFYGMLAARVLDDGAPAAVPGAVFAEGGSYPVPRWKPPEGFTVDPALVFAIIRQESKFDPEAQSGAGAIGLMQIMPQTAQQVTQRKSNWDEALYDPVTNVAIGQRYVRFLLDRDNVSRNLILMAAAYNGGPTALSRWRRENAEEDPLLFLETWPVGETRGFIEQVLANYWIYRVRLGRDTASLTDLAHGRWPLYVSPPLEATVVADSR